ncbi:MAG: hypothetical protein H7Y00_04700 [Fimbriimonadaceae bacterium]|nr:hypothetical protein [Chitinophagales bacterium]
MVDKLFNTDSEEITVTYELDPLGNTVENGDILFKFLYAWVDSQKNVLLAMESGHSFEVIKGDTPEKLIEIIKALINVAFDELISEYKGKESSLFKKELKSPESPEFYKKLLQYIQF